MFSRIEWGPLSTHGGAFFRSRPGNVTGKWEKESEIYWTGKKDYGRIYYVNCFSVKRCFVCRNDIFYMVYYGRL